MDIKRIFKSWLLIALGVLIASHVFAGIHYSDSSALVVAVLLLSLCNVFLKPLLMLFALPFIIMTFGLGIWLINALLFLLVGNLVDGFDVDSFAYALAGAFVVSLTGFAANMFFGNSRVQVRTTRSAGNRPSEPTASRQPHRQKPLQDDDVIDI
ncbi:phage holin family protein [Coraliomargarita algicola]|uniref:Phage holin family protein n=1 Tax=Coraliomargarita algicola TaxID=3092156 RepID=A0ABZ0RP44_9BACT|nr:phage holin family protein [Coraliomargarita sp. J2-16]WPJ97994.1 phage holin family protein [Coraliomargarita sp. J2-16]